MKDCCNHSIKNKKCVRRSDKKSFKLPRKYNLKRCKKGIKGFTMKSSCAAYNDCLGGGKKLTKRMNINNHKLKVCSKDPITGFYRDGYCMTGTYDLGTHTICAKMDKKFLDYTASKGNNLYSVVGPGDKWCLCENRWEEAYDKDIAPKVIQSATNMRTKKRIIQKIKKKRKYTKKGGRKKTFLFNPKNPKKSFDVYIDKNPKDTISIKYKTINDVKNTIKKLERLYKSNKYTHKRIWQVGMIMKVRLEVLKKKKPNEYKLANKYFKFLKKRTKIKNEIKRKKLKF